MLYLYTRDKSNRWQNSPYTYGTEIDAGVLWIDVQHPTAEEDRFVEQLLGIEIPTREDMRDIEPSSRLYLDHGIAVMTASIIVGADTPKPVISPVTFILTQQRLYTIRYAEPSSFNRFASRLLRQPNQLASGEDIFLNLLGAIVDREAEILENCGHSLDLLSSDIFSNRDEASDTMNSIDTTHLKRSLKRLGTAGNMVSLARESLVSIARLLSFSGPAAESWLRGDSQSTIKSLTRDVRFLSEHADSLNMKINFLLDAILGLIDLEQTNTVKVLSVASVTFLPPTLIASIFGMNFSKIPGLDSMAGFLVSILLIFISAIVPYFLFYRKKL